MAFSVQAIRYGWVALASLGVITGTTIYVINNQRHQVKPQDIIEIVVGTHERCLATQYSTNPVSYYISPPSFVRTWYSNVYTTNGVTVYTNVVTNTIGWHIDRNMMVSLDTTIKALVPYYCDTNTVYDGTTNIVMLTVTGLWASLGIGDKTNKFTREPAWTNSVSTNWIVNYTNTMGSGQLGGTNYIYSETVITNSDGSCVIDGRSVLYYDGGIINSNICYTTDQDRVVWVVTNVDMGVTPILYATYTNIGGGYPLPNIKYYYLVYPSPNKGFYLSNFPQVVQTITNVATYGDYPWQIYKEDLEERYKVLNALKVVNLGEAVGTNFGNASDVQIWATCQTGTLWQADAYIGIADGTIYDIMIGSDRDNYEYNYEITFGRDSISGGDSAHLPYWIRVNTIISNTTSIVGMTLKAPSNLTKIWNCIITDSVGAYSNQVSYSESDLLISVKTTNNISVRVVGKIFATTTPQFSYCTNKYW